MRQRTGKSETINIVDASAEAVKILAPQIASDKNTIAEGHYDRKRLSNLNDVEVLFCAYFYQVPKYEGGEFAVQFCDNYLDLKMSKDGRRAKDIVTALGNIGSSQTHQPKPQDRRNWIQRNITQKNKGPEEFE